MKIRIEYFGVDAPDYFPFPTAYYEPEYKETFWGVGECPKTALETGFSFLYSFSEFLPIQPHQLNEFLEFIKTQYDRPTKEATPNGFSHYFRFTVFDDNKWSTTIECNPYGANLVGTFWS